MNNNYSKIIKAIPFILLIVFCVVSFSYLRVMESISPNHHGEVIGMESEYRGTLVVSTKLQYNPEVKIITDGEYKDKIFKLSEESDLFLNVGAIIPVSIDDKEAKYLIKKEKAYFYLLVLLLTLLASILKIMKIYKKA